MTTDNEQLKLRFEISSLFTPASPINEKSLFADRPIQVRKVVETISQRGQHAIIYGERGVGKTSLANVLSDFLSGIGQTVVAPRVAVTSADGYADVWRRAFDQIKLNHQIETMGLVPQTEQRIGSLAENLPANITPDLIGQLLASIGSECILVLVIDEFDRLSEKGDTRLVADTIKTMSDASVPATLVLVGVAESVDDLIDGHESVLRNLIQIPMPRMTSDELRQIVESRLPKLGMSIEPEALTTIVELSRGLPHYVHLVGQHAAINACEQKQTRIDSSHVSNAMAKSIENAQQSLQSAYHVATTSPQKNLYTEVLLACSLAPADELGYFAAADVREPLKRVTGREYEIPSFSRHLAAFASSARQQVLQSKGGKNQRRFRFKDPLMQPYVIMRGLRDGLVDSATVL